MSGNGPTSDDREALLQRRRRSASSVPLLTAREELDQAALVAKGRAAENELAAIGAASVAELEHVAELRRLVRRGETARDALIRSSGHLVDLLADRRATDADHRADLLDAGDEALSRAIDRYDATAGLPFTSFARWWVERAMRELDGPLDPPAGDPPRGHPTPGDPTLRTALGQLNEDDCQVIELRLGLDGSAPRTAGQVAKALDLTIAEEQAIEEQALAKLRHPCTPGDLTDLTELRDP